jgi:hypothetical protein
MDMHFAYTLAQNTLSDALLASVGPVNKTLLKVEFHPTPLHFLTPRQIVDCMFQTHALLTGPDFKKLRAPLSEPLTCLPSSRADTCLSPPSLGSSVKHTAYPNEDTCARASPASLLRPKSEGTKPALVRESKAAFVFSQVSSLPACLLTCLSPKPISLARPNPLAPRQVS